MVYSQSFEVDEMKRKAKITAKVTAKGVFKGKPVVVEVVRQNGGLDENGDLHNGTIKILKDGIDYNSDDAEIESKENALYLHALRNRVVKRCLKQMRATHVYNPMPHTIEAYWLAFNYGDGFDEVPEITVEGEIDTLGSPFSDEDTSNIVF